MSKDSAHAILRDDLNMHRVAAKFVPKLLSPEQKDLRFEVAQDLLDTANTDPEFLNTVITGDESWAVPLLNTFSHLERIGNPTNTLCSTSLSDRQAATDALDGGDKIHACA